MGLEGKSNWLLDDRTRRRVYGPRYVVDSGWWCLTYSTFYMARVFHVGDDARCDAHGLNRPFRIDDVLLRWPPSWIPRGCFLPSGWDVLARCFLRQPVRLEFALIWAPLQQFLAPVLAFCRAPSLCRTTFVLALWWSRLSTFALALSPRPLNFAAGSRA